MSVPLRTYMNRKQRIRWHVSQLPSYLPRMCFILCTGLGKHDRNTDQYLQVAVTDSSQVSVVSTDLYSSLFNIHRPRRTCKLRKPVSEEISVNSSNSGTLQRFSEVGLLHMDGRPGQEDVSMCPGWTWKHWVGQRAGCGGRGAQGGRAGRGGGPLLRSP